MEDRTRDGPTSLKGIESLVILPGFESDEVRSPEGQRCEKSRFGCEFGLLWSTSWMLVMMERRGDGVNQSLLVLSNDLKSNSRPFAYFRRKTRSRQFEFARGDLHSGCGGGRPSPNSKTPEPMGNPGTPDRPGPSSSERWA